MRILKQYFPKTVVSFDGATIYYETSGDLHTKPLLLLLHGLGGDVTSWDDERVAFGYLGYPTLAVDLRGHGFSQRSGNQDFYSMEAFAQDILAIIEQEHLRHVVLVGHCFGGMVALQLEAKKKVGSGLVLVDSSYKPPHMSEFVTDHRLVWKVFSWLASHSPAIGAPGHAESMQFIGTTDFDKKRLFSDLVHTSLRSYLLAFRTALSFDATDLLKWIVVPTLILEGTADSVFPPEIAQELHNRIARSQVRYIEANHIIVLNNPSELVYAIDQFCKQIWSPERRSLVSL